MTEHRHTVPSEVIAVLKEWLKQQDELKVTKVPEVRACYWTVKTFVEWHESIERSGDFMMNSGCNLTKRTHTPECKCFF